MVYTMYYWQVIVCLAEGSKGYKDNQCSFQKFNQKLRLFFVTSMLYIEVKTLNRDSFTSAILSKEFLKCPETKIVFVFGLFCQVSNKAFSTCIPVMLSLKHSI